MHCQVGCGLGLACRSSEQKEPLPIHIVKTKFNVIEMLLLPVAYGIVLNTRQKNI